MKEIDQSAIGYEKVISFTTTCQLQNNYIFRISCGLMTSDRNMRGMHYSFIAFTFSWRCGQQYVDQVASPFATCTLLLCAATELILDPGFLELLALIS